MLAAPALLAFAAMALPPGSFHRRIDTPAGAVHVWRPAEYRAIDAATVVYLHGYGDDVDSTWSRHRLADQFAASGANALFVVAESPTGPADSVKWTDPAALLATVRRGAGIEVPERHVVAVGHSGAYRTVLSWLRHDLPHAVVLVDAFYAGVDEFTAFAKRESTLRRPRLIIASRLTERRALALLNRVGDAVTETSIPDRGDGLRRFIGRSRVVHLRSQYGHADLIEGGRALPVLIDLAANRTAVAVAGPGGA